MIDRDKSDHSMGQEFTFVYEIKSKNPSQPQSRPMEMDQIMGSLQIQKLQAEIEFLKSNASTLRMQELNTKYHIYFGYLAELRAIMTTYRMDMEADHVPGTDRKLVPLIDDHTNMFKVVQDIIMRLKKELVDDPKTADKEAAAKSGQQ